MIALLKAAQPSLPERAGTSEPAVDPAVAKPTLRTAPDLDGEGWSIRAFRAGVWTAIFLELAYLLQVMKTGARDLRLLLVGLPGIVAGLSWCRSFQRYWRPAAFGMLAAVIGGTAAPSVVDGQTVPFFVVAILTLGATGLLPWDEYWQGTSSACVIVAFAIVEALIP